MARRLGTKRAIFAAPAGFHVHECARIDRGAAKTAAHRVGSGEEMDHRFERPADYRIEIGGGDFTGN